VVDARYETKRRDLERRILTQPGTLPNALRRAAFEGRDLPDDVAAYVAKVRDHAYTVTDGEVADLLSRGWSQDQLFELTLSAALGAATQRLHAGWGMLEKGGAQHAADAT
jgi:alkylhydroperoxidase family enzyme